MSGSLSDEIIGIIKYSSDGNKMWSNIYDVDRITTFYPGFTELDNGKLVAVTNNLIYVISENGALLNTIDVSNTLGNFLGFRYTGDGAGTVCAAICQVKTGIITSILLSVGAIVLFGFQV